jgi:hypothetical protein
MLLLKIAAATTTAGERRTVRQQIVDNIMERRDDLIGQRRFLWESIYEKESMWFLLWMMLASHSLWLYLSFLIPSISISICMIWLYSDFVTVFPSRRKKNVNFSPYRDYNFNRTEKQNESVTSFQLIKNEERVPVVRGKQKRVILKILNVLAYTSFCSTYKPSKKQYGIKTTKTTHRQCS